MSRGIPQPQVVPQQQDLSARNQQLGLFLASLSDVLGGRDPLRGTMQRQQFIQQQQLLQEQKQKLAEQKAAREAFFKERPELRDIYQAMQAGIPKEIFLPSEREIIKGADGYQYYADTGERVLPGVVKAEETDRKIVEGADGFKYYADTGERVLPGVEQAAKKYDMKQDAAGYWRYTEGPQKGERVFVDVEKPDPLPDIKDESALRKEFNSQSTYFKGIAQSFGKILATDPTAAGDVSLIFAYMKMLDPTSVVREGEQATAREAEGIPGRILNLYNRAVTGESLTPDQRADFRKQAQNIYDLAFEDQSLNLARYTDIAKRKGFDPDVIVFDYSKGIEPKIFEDSLRRKTLLDLQNLDATQYTEEQLEILAQVLSEKLQPNQ